VSSSPLNVRLDQYEGPLDLLLDLIRKQQIDIYNIPIARITAQYLEYLDQAAALDIELGAEFIFMAATLIHIKSRMLLPRDPELEKISPEEDPRQELVRKLIEHERFKNAAEMLQQKRLIEENVWSNPQLHQFIAEESEPELAVSLIDLVKTFEQVLNRLKARPTYQVNDEEVTVPDMIRYVAALVRRSKGPISALKLFEQQRSRRALVCLLLAILELVKLQALTLTQEETFGPIALRKHKRFDEVLTSEDGLADIDKDYN
jgi:segregation and condensation protein A